MRLIKILLPIIILGLLSIPLLSSDAEAEDDVLVIDGFTYALTESGAGNYADITAFDNSESKVTIKAVVVDDSKIEYKVRSINSAVFKNNTVLEELTVESNKYFSFNPEQFSGCTKLSKVTLGEGITRVDSSAFKGCTSLETVILPSTITEIGESAFDGCSSLTTVVWPSALESIKDMAFRNCTKLGNPQFGESLKTIGDHAFVSCEEFTSVSIPNSVVSIGRYAFLYDSKLSEVTLGNNLQSIGHAAFDRTLIKSISLPASLTDIAFDRTDGLRTIPSDIEQISVGPSNPRFYSEDNMVIERETDTIVFSAFRSGEITLSHNLGEDTFYGMDLTKVVVSEGVTTLGFHAFAYNSKLVEVTLPSTITYNSLAFSCCENLATISFAEGTKVVGGFSGCKSLVEVRLPGSVETILTEAFSSCSTLKTINLPEGLTHIGARAFQNCPVLENVVLPSTLTFVGTNAFNGYVFDSLTLGTENPITVEPGAIKVDTLTINKVTSENLPGIVTLVKNAKTVIYGNDFDAWEYKNHLAISKDGKTVYLVEPGYSGKITIPSTVEYFCGPGFQNVTTLTEIDCEDINSTITFDVQDKGNIYGTFYGCTNLQSVKLPNVILNDPYVFGKCSKLTSVSFTSVKALPANTFNGTKISELILNEGCTTIAKDALKGITTGSVSFISFPSSLTAVEGNPGIDLYEGTTKVTFTSSNAGDLAKKLAGRSFTFKISNINNDLNTYSTSAKLTAPKSGELLVNYHVGTKVYHDITTVNKTSYGVTVKLSSSPDHYVTGWYYDKDFTKPFDKNVPLTEDLDLYGKLGETPVGTTVLFKEYVMGYTFFELVVSGQPHIVSEPIIPAGYAFEKWYSDKNYSSEYDSSVGLTKAPNLYAKLVPIEYTFTFMNGDDKIADVKFTVENMAEQKLPEVPAKDHYTGAWAVTEFSLEDKTVNAVYTPIEYTFTFMNGDDKIADVKFTVENMASQELPAVPEKEHYVDGTWTVDRFSLDNKTVKAIYTPVEYTFTFIEGEVVIKVVEFNADNINFLTLPAVPAKTNMVGHWDVFGFELENKTVNAVYEKTAWTLEVTGAGEADKVFWTKVNDRNGYGIITAYPAEFQTIEMTVVSENGIIAKLSENAWIVYSDNAADVSVRAVFADVGAATEYGISIHEVVKDGAPGFRVVLEAENGYIDTTGTLSIGYVYKTFDAEKGLWCYTTSGTNGTTGVQDAVIDLGKDKQSIASGDYYLDVDGGYMVYGYAVYKTNVSVSDAVETHYYSTPVIMSVSEIQAVISKN